ncbi:MAG TPA: N,N-dimethylformamidase beta subunit family domain-containing protein [Actinocrinis sp.]|uniref:N,N-dimethylformamidase beta subunit family domain-containing protein n=1 Tax=Actinocrinis sp. TaxID=1920516 RepID=UPI002DDDB897|nr:N,N-dimethylformamidase beta subunit family domain-containing protein [Actinocrinis sp.]HEV2347013.1 N,N-dimethylformamidase beta subunit family domain-containing protein [Actinocrinis sp.]
MGADQVNGYSTPTTVIAGETLNLHVSTRAARFSADFYRFGNPARYVGSCDWPGAYVPDGVFDRDWQWPAYEFPVPRDWEPGAYIAVLRTSATRPLTRPSAQKLDARCARLLFAIRPDSPRSGCLLVKLPLSTYHAYNQAGGGSLYGTCDGVAPAQVSTVTLNRPGGGVGGPVKGVADYYDASSPRQTFAHWDGKLLTWLDSEGIGYDVCTDLDIDQGMPLTGYSLIVSAGHDEYWTARTREQIEDYCAHGGNLAVLGANTCWWRTRAKSTGALLICEKFPPGAAGVDPDSTRGCPDKWWEARPENSLLGASYRNAGGHWDGPREQIGYEVRYPGHWAFDGTGLAAGDVFGAEGALVGYECDGAQLDFDHDGRLGLTYRDGTPESLDLLGLAVLPEGPRSGWSFPVREHETSVRAATLSVHVAGGTVFNAGTTDWPRLLLTDPVVQLVTRNVLRRLGGEESL